MGHFGNISYNVFNRGVSLLMKLQTSYFAMYCRKQYFTRKAFGFEKYTDKFSIFRKVSLPGFGVTKHIMLSRGEE